MDTRLILVAGSGRSGTSLFSGILKAMGCHVPQPEVQADDSNPRGFGEAQWVVDFHTRLLRKASVHTSDARPSAWAATAQVAMDRAVEHELHRWLSAEIAKADHVVIKDPRLLWFPALWDVVGTNVGAAVRYATLLRHPLEVTKSKQTYYAEQLLPTSRTAGWVNMMLYLERATRGAIRTFVKYDDLLEDWTLTVAAVCEKLDLPVIERVQTPEMRVINQFVDPSLRRSTGDWKSLGVHGAVADMAETTWSALERLKEASDAEIPAVHAELDELREEYRAFYDLAEATAQSSILAERRRRRSGRKPGGGETSWSNAAFTARLKRRARRELRKVRDRMRTRAPSPSGPATVPPRSVTTARATERLATERLAKENPVAAAETSELQELP